MLEVTKDIEALENEKVALTAEQEQRDAAMQEAEQGWKAKVQAHNQQLGKARDRLLQIEGALDALKKYASVVVEVGPDK